MFNPPVAAAELVLLAVAFLLPRRVNPRVATTVLALLMIAAWPVMNLATSGSNFEDSGLVMGLVLFGVLTLWMILSYALPLVRNWNLGTRRSGLILDVSVGGWMLALQFLPPDGEYVGLVFFGTMPIVGLGAWWLQGWQSGTDPAPV